METEGSLPSSEQPVTRPYIRPDESNPTHFNIVLKSTPRSFKWSSSIRFPHQSPVCTSPFPPTCPAHLILWFDQPNNNWRGGLGSVACYLVLLRPPTVFHSYLFSNTLRVRNQVSRPHKTSANFRVLCVSVFRFLGIRSCWWKYSGLLLRLWSPEFRVIARY